MSSIFGKKFTYMWADANKADMKQLWTEALGGMDARDIRSALDACKELEEPPVLGKFLSLCRLGMNERREADKQAAIDAEDFTKEQIAENKAKIRTGLREILEKMRAAA